MLLNLHLPFCYLFSTCFLSFLFFCFSLIAFFCVKHYSHTILIPGLLNYFCYYILFIIIEI